MELKIYMVQKTCEQFSRLVHANIYMHEIMKLQSCHNLDFAFHLLYSELERLYKIKSFTCACIHGFCLQVHSS